MNEGGEQNDPNQRVSNPLEPSAEETKGQFMSLMFGMISKQKEISDRSYELLERRGRKLNDPEVRTLMDEDERITETLAAEAGRIIESADAEDFTEIMIDSVGNESVDGGSILRQLRAKGSLPAEIMRATFMERVKKYGYIDGGHNQLEDAGMGMIVRLCLAHEALRREAANKPKITIINP